MVYPKRGASCSCATRATSATSSTTRPAARGIHNGQVYQGTYNAFEQQVAVAEQLAWVHTFSDGITRDSGDVLNELMEFAIQWRNATGLPTMAK